MAETIKNLIAGKMCDAASGRQLVESCDNAIERHIAQWAWAGCGASCRVDVAARRLGRGLSAARFAPGPGALHRSGPFASDMAAAADLPITR